MTAPLTDDDLAAIRRDIAAVQRLTFAHLAADRLATEHAPALLAEVERLRAAPPAPALARALQAVVEIPREDVARVIRDYLKRFTTPGWGATEHDLADVVLALFAERIAAALTEGAS